MFTLARGIPLTTTKDFDIPKEFESFMDPEKPIEEEKDTLMVKKTGPWLWKVATESMGFSLCGPVGEGISEDPLPKTTDKPTWYGINMSAPNWGYLLQSLACLIDFWVSYVGCVALANSLSGPLSSLLWLRGYDESDDPSNVLEDEIKHWKSVIIAKKLIQRLEFGHMREAREQEPSHYYQNFDIIDKQRAQNPHEPLGVQESNRAFPSWGEFFQWTSW